MVFGHSWKASTPTSVSPRQSSWMMSPSSSPSNPPPPAAASTTSSSVSPSARHQQAPVVFGIFPPTDASGGVSHHPSIANVAGRMGATTMTTTTGAATTASSSAAPLVMDFESLLVNSSSLLSSMGRTTNGERGATATTRVVGGGGLGLTGAMSSRGILHNQHRKDASSTSSYQDEASAHRLFAREGLGFDSADLGRRARELERRVATEVGMSAQSHTRRNNITGNTTTRNHPTSRWEGDDTQEEKKSSLDGLDDYNYEQNNFGATSMIPASMTLRELLDAHHHHCIESAIRIAHERSKQLSQQRIEERLQMEWIKRREEVLQQGVVGNRFLLGSSSRSHMYGVERGGVDTQTGGIGKDLVPFVHSVEVATNTRKNETYCGIIPSPQIIPAVAEHLVKSHLSSVEGHLTTITTAASAATTSSMISFEQISPLTKNDTSLHLLSSLEEGLKEFALACANNDNVTSGGIIITPEHLNGYSNAFSLIRSIVNCRTALGITPSNTTSVASSSAYTMMMPATTYMTTTTKLTNNDDDNTTSITLSFAANVMGTCHFFSQQFSSHIRETVQEAELGGWSVPLSDIGDTSSSSGTLARDICAYSTLTIGNDIMGERSSGGGGAVWPRLYYCLRSGDAIAATIVLEQFSKSIVGDIANSSIEDVNFVDPAVSDLVSELASLQTTHTTIFFLSQLLSPTHSMIQSRRRIAELYERIQVRLMSLSQERGGGGMKGDVDPLLNYRNACLAMLGGKEFLSEVNLGLLVKTVEDYLFVSLWHALHSTNATIEGGGLRDVADAVARLSVHVNQWGPSYFEHDDDVKNERTLYSSASEAVTLAGGGAPNSTESVPRSGGWAYTLPLLASQQYATALAYLADAGGGLGLLQATHVGIIMDMAGLVVTDFSFDERSGIILKSSTLSLLPMLVASYSTSLQGSNPGAALNYLALMSRKGEFVKEQVQRLLLETRQFEMLAGKIDSNGCRMNGALDMYFTNKEISSLLVDSANRAIRYGKSADAAELLVLSRRFGVLFSLMNRELASCLNASTPEGITKRQFWFNAASQFHAVHLARGRTYVQSTLDAEGNMSLGNTFQLLMNLMVFFDRCRENQWEGAWALMDDLQLIPKTESEMSVRVEAFRALDICVRQVFQHVVLAAMEALCHIFYVLKQGRAGVSIDQHSTTDRSLGEIQTRARLLVTFARLLNLPSLGDADTYVRISELEKNMM